MVLSMSRSAPDLKPHRGGRSALCRTRRPDDSCSMRPTPRRPLVTVSRRPDTGRRRVARALPGRRHRFRNLAQELLMLLGLAVVLGAVAWLLTGLGGLLWVLVTVLVLGALRPRVPTAWVLSMYQAPPLPRWAAPRLHEVVDVIAVRAGLHH